MKNEHLAEPRESLFVWSSEGIRHVRKKMRETLRVSARISVGAVEPEIPLLEQRRYPRLDMKLPILYKVLGSGKLRLPSSVRPFLLTETTNVSPIGLCMSLTEYLVPETILALSIHVVEKRERFNALARVLWCRPDDTPGHFLTGLQFVVVDQNKVKEEKHTKMQEVVRALEKEEISKTTEFL